MEKGKVFGNLRFLVKSGSKNILAQNFIRKRGFRRWITHFLLAWGTVIAALITFPLVFGWIHFETQANDPEMYQVFVFGIQMDQFPIQSVWRYIMFNLLNLAAVMVIVGAGLALLRRLADPGAIARQQFGNDIVPLITLLAISVTGLMLTVSMHALHGYGYTVISLVHALTVIAALLYIPYGKFFHIFQRPIQLSVALYKKSNAALPPIPCRVCKEPFVGPMHQEDMKEVLLAMRLSADDVEICPRCRRRRLGVAQDRVMSEARTAR